MGTVEVLRAARSVIADKSRWYVGGYYALDDRGHECEPLDEGAIAWCAVGAVVKVEGEFGPAYTALYSNNARSVTRTNDTGDHVATLAMFDRAIAAEEAKAAPADVPLYVPSAWLPVEVPA
jgi:hypothetical protein